MRCTLVGGIATSSSSVSRAMRELLSAWSGGTLSAPRLLDRRDELPGGLDHVRALKQRPVAEHRVEQQALVARARPLAEVVLVAKIHVHRVELQARARDLGLEAQRQAFVRLDAQ